MSGTTLVTGGAGYIGSHTVRALRTAGRAVVVLDTLELGHADAVVDAPLVVGDIADEALVERLCREHSVDTIVHFAAYKNVGDSMREPSKYFRNNVDGTVRLLDAARRAGVGQVVFSSSCSVYGTPDSVPVDESQAIRPESVYAETKAIVERVLHWYGEVHGMRSVSLRYFNAAGASFDAPARRGLDVRAQPGAGGDEGAAARRHPPAGVRRRLPTPSTARAFATTSMSTTSPTPTSPRSTTSTGGGSTTALNSAPASARR